jgi:hypothetical protein
MVDTLLVGDLVEVLVRRGVTGDLMFVGIHLRDHTCPILINRAFAQVVTSNEECRLGTTSFGLGHNMLSVDVWAIVIVHRDGLWLEAFADSQTAILDVPELATVVVGSTGSVRSLVAIAAWAKVDLAVRRSAVLPGIAAISLHGMSTDLLHSESHRRRTSDEQQKPAAHEVPPP